MLRNTIIRAGVLCIGMTSLHAYAQSSVTLFGLIDTGVTYISNQNGHSNLKMDDGINGPSIWGISGKEDLGGGTYAVFNLTDQFHIDSGAVIAGQSEFSRNAYVGLDNNRYGRLTMGEQYDFMTDSLFFSHDDPADMAGHFYGFRAGPFTGLGIPDNATGGFDWDRMAGETVGNSIKYLSPSYQGLSFGAMYGFGNVAGSIGSGNASSFGLNYVNGHFGANAAYTDVKYTETTGDVGIRNWGVGTHYSWDRWMINALMTTVKNTSTGAFVGELSSGVQYRPQPDLAIGLSYMYMKGNAILNNNHAHQISSIAEYSLSKRTSIYTMAVYQRVNHGAYALVNGITDTDGSSTSESQLLLRVGLHTRF